MKKFETIEEFREDFYEFCRKNEILNDVPLWDSFEYCDDGLKFTIECCESQVMYPIDEMFDHYKKIAESEAEKVLNGEEPEGYIEEDEYLNYVWTIMDDIQENIWGIDPEANYDELLQDREYFLQNSRLSIANEKELSDDAKKNIIHYQLNDMIVFVEVVMHGVKVMPTAKMAKEDIGISPLEYFQIAKKNTQEKYPLEFCLSDCGLLVATAPEVGSACFVYDGFFEKVYERVQDDFYVDMTAVDGMLILPINDINERQYKKAYKKLAKRSKVEKKSHLSYAMYKYDHSIGDCVAIAV